MSMTSEQMILRNGRSTSQVSIYDYPEHLNPFYEDENHKRLRFWKIGKRNGDSRRGSFSMAGLKEMWAFKSFRLKKKSSSLGINKTSESPPTLRRNLDPSELNYGTYDSRMRYTTGANTLNGYFQRNVPYRSSLQDMRTTQNVDRNGYGDMGFARNDKYRSTIQTPGMRNEISGYSPRVLGRRYVYGGSETPQPSIRSNFSDPCSGISRGSSQLSVSSTNPFEDDEGDVIVGRISTGETDGSNSQTPSKRPNRKKRRAPLPPVPVPKIIIEESSSNPTTPSTSQQNQNSTTENIEITNLTAEIENFVKTTTTEDADSSVAHKDVSTTGIEVKESSPAREIPAAPDREPAQGANEPEISEDKRSLDDNLRVDESPECTATNDTSVMVDENNLNIEDIPCNAQYATTVVNVPNIELKITESKEDLSIQSETSNDTVTTSGNNSNGGSRFQIRYVPLKDSSPEPEPEMRTCTRTSSLNDVKEPNGVVSYERRRSVKEIIESINRSQSLLKVSQEQIAQAMIDSPVNNLNEPAVRAPPRKKHDKKEISVGNLEEITDSERKIHQMIQDMEKSSKEAEEKNMREAEVDELIEKLTDKLNNNEDNCNEIFKKCSVRKEINRESSPTSSNLDWNPVPKPKRTKNLSPELTKTIKTIKENVEN